MKKKIAQILLLAIVISTSAFAGKNNDRVNGDIKSTFTQKFSDAREISWATTDKYFKASFQLDGQYMSAFYSKNNELLGISRNLTTSQLPINLQSELKKNIAGGWITELFEYATEGETTYYATIENGDQRVFVKSAAGSWEETKKVKKN